jgi:predicted MFS family arabinose efflux permease
VDDVTVAGAGAGRPAVPPVERGVSAGLILLFAIAAGCGVANLYYVQPLLPLLQRGLHASTGEVALVATITQVGYVLGLVFVLPLGDMLERRRLIPLTTLALSGALVLAGTASTIAMLLVAMLLVGAAAVMTQIIVPFAASLAPEASRGRVVGLVMSGLLVGILLARTVSGALAQLLGWRPVFYSAAVLMAVVGLVLARKLPHERNRTRPSYAELLASLLELRRTEPRLRRRALFGALSFGAFTVLWTSIAFLLAGSPYHYGSSRIGLFGLVGAAGVVMANAAGRLADRGRVAWLTTANALGIIIAFVALYFGRHSLIWLIVGVVLLDAGAQGMQVTNQSVIYQLRPGHRSRINAVYMIGLFLGGAAASGLVAALYSTTGWPGVCALGGALGLCALALSVPELSRATTGR